jgi:uncharacterized protein (TIGR02246 family)
MTQDEQTLHDLVKNLENAWNAADHAGFTAPFADDAIFIHIFGGQLDGREAIEEAHQFIFNGIYKGSRNQYTVREIRFLRSDAAIVLLEAHLHFEVKGEPHEIHTRPTLIATRDDGRWVFRVFHNTRITEMPGAPTASSD